jgi:membrane fusion protein, multidrug efflux system
MLPLPLHHMIPRRSSRDQRVIGSASLPLLGAITALLSGCAPSPAARIEARPVRTFVVGSMQTDASRSTGAYAGAVVARIESNIGFQVPGRLVTRLAEVGQHVRAGTPLARLDAQDLALGVESARAALRAAEADAANATSDVTRAKALHAEGILTDAALERATTSAATATARRSDARARAEMAENSARYAILSSPTTGIVTAALAESGQVLAAGQPVFTIARDCDRDVAIDIPEGRISAIRNGQRAQVSLDDGATAATTAVIREVSPAADPVSGTYRVRLTLQGSQGIAAMPLGRSVSVRLVSGETVQALRIPSSAVVQTKSTAGVWVMAGARDRVRFQPVAIAGMSDGMVTIRSGVRAGDEIVSAGTNRLDSALVVTPWNGRMP